MFATCTTLTGQLQRKQGPDGPSTAAPFYLHNVCSPPNFIVMLLNKDRTANLVSYTWVRFGVHNITHLPNSVLEMQPTIDQ